MLLTEWYYQKIQSFLAAESMNGLSSAVPKWDVSQPVIILVLMDSLNGNPQTPAPPLALA